MPSTLSRSYSVPVSFVPQPTRSKDASIVSFYFNRDPEFDKMASNLVFADFFLFTTTLLRKTLSFQGFYD